MKERGKIIKILKGEKTFRERECFRGNPIFYSFYWRMVSGMIRKYLDENGK